MEQLEKEVEICNLLKKNMIEFLDELIDQFEQEPEPDLIIMRFFIHEQIPVADIMNRFIQHVYPLKSKIIQKDEKFFIENNNIFGSSPEDKVIHFKELYVKMSDENRKVLWDWFTCFIMICDKYITFMNKK